MIRKIFLTSAVLSLLLASGCDKASDDQQKASAAQNEATGKIIAARAEADKKIGVAMTEADKKISEAQASFMKRREDYRHQTTVNLVALDQKVEELTSKAKTSKGKAQTDLDANLKQISVSRAEFLSNYNTLETASAITWDATQAVLDKEWTELKALVDKA